MISKISKRARFGLAMLAAGTAMTALPAAAQVPQYGQFREDPGSALNRHLRSLADQPRNLEALIGAGKAALELGDAQAALTFFARAEEVAPRNGRVKAGMGSAFLRMEQPVPAMRFFDEAMALGIPEAEFAGDRGLAFDLAGNQRRAQADYAIALRRQEDPEVRRRLALSLAISGERDKALATIDDQLRRHDRIAWRTRAFILALSGDAAEATRTTQSVMPGLASQLSPFYAKLASLGPADRAMAVHFGHLPVGTPTFVAPPQNQYASAAPAATAQAQPTQRGSVRPSPAAAPAATSRPTAAPTQQASSAPSQRIRNSRMRDRWDPRSESRGLSPDRRTTVADTGPATVAAREPARQPAPSQAAPWQQAPVQTQSRSTTPVAQAPAPVRAQPSWTTPAAQAPARVQAQPSWTAPAAQAEARVQSQPSWMAPVAQASAPSISPAPTAQAPAQPAQPVAQQPASAAQTPVEAVQPVALAQAPAEAPAATLQALPGFSLSPAANSSPAIQPVQLASSNVAVTDAPAPAQSGPSEAEPDFAEIAAVVAQLPREAPPQPAPKPVVLAQADVPNPARATEEKAPAKKEEASKPPAPKAEAAKKEERSKTAEKTQLAKKEEPSKTRVQSAAAKKDDAKKTAKKEETAKKPEPKEPSRVWVQVAGGADKAALPREFAKLKDKAPKLLGNQTAWTTPLRFTNRLLVGPFKSEKEAQAFVNELNKLDFAAFSWTSPAGQEIEKLAVK